MIRYFKLVTRAHVVCEPNTLFVFGDNLERRGYGGQAASMRGEPNAVGIPTKHSPTMHEDAFFTDDDLPLFLKEAAPAIMRLLLHEGVIIWPSDGIGTGKARLDIKAPKIFMKINLIRQLLE